MKKFPFLLFLIFLSIFPLLSIWRTGIYQSGDMGTHVMFLISFYHSLQQGIFFPRWSAEFCAGFGYPHMQFFYQLPYYIASLFHFVGFGFIDSIKLLMCVSFLGAAATMFWWLKTEFGERAAFVGALFYAFAPYQLIDLHFNVALGESLAFVFVPLLFLCVKKLGTSSKKVIWFGGFVAILVALILTHPVAPLISLPFVVAYSFVLLKKTFVIFAAITFSLLLTCYHWLPILAEGQLIQQSQLQVVSFPQWWEFFFAPWKFGFLFQGHHGEVSPLIGYAQLILFAIGVAMNFRSKLKKNDRLLLRFFLISVVLLFLFMQSFTKSFWLTTPILNNFQTSRRLVFMIIILNAGIAAIVTKNLRTTKFTKYFLITICTFAYLSTILNWGSRAMIRDVTDHIVTLQIPTRCDRVALPIWVKQTEVATMGLSRFQDLEVLQGAANFVELPRTFIRHEYVVNAKTDATFKENTTYFPSWVLFVNGKRQKIDYQNPSAPGIITILLKPGLYSLTLEYRETPIEAVAKWVSLTTLGLTFLSPLIIHFHPDLV